MFNKETTIQAILYVLSKKRQKKASIHELAKILYFADQEHLSRYGRSITGDSYIAMKYGPVPSSTYDLLKALRGDGYFADQVEQERQLLLVRGRYEVQALRPADLDALSLSDRECLDQAATSCEDLSFDERTQLSHGEAWCQTAANEVISLEDMLREKGDSPEYIRWVSLNNKASLVD